MTISNTASSVKVYGNGAQTVFNYGFEIAGGAGYALYYEDTSGNVTLLNPSTYTVGGNWYCHGRHLHLSGHSRRTAGRERHVLDAGS